MFLCPFPRLDWVCSPIYTDHYIFVGLYPSLSLLVFSSFFLFFSFLLFFFFIVIYTLKKIVIFILFASLPSRSRHFHTRHLREWRRFQTALCTSDIQISSTRILFCCFTSVCPFVRCCVEGAENVHIVLSSPD